MHQNHEEMGVPIAKRFLERLDAPEWKKIVLFVTENHGKMHILNTMKTDKIIAFAKEVEEAIGLDAFIVATSSDKNGRISTEKNFLEHVQKTIHPNASLLRRALTVEEEFPIDSSIELTEEEKNIILSNPKIPESNREKVLASKRVRKQEAKQKKKIEKAINEEKKDA